LWARQKNGSFILRIEDTDRSRSTEEAIESIKRDLRWLGLAWDEGPDVGGGYGPYRQTEREDIYHKKVKELIESGQAYYCYCTSVELQAQREQAKQERTTYRYNRRFRFLSPEERQKLEKENPQPVVRLAMPLSGSTIVNDLIRGSVRFDHRELDDFIILRSDGTPTYNLAAAVDDALMKITHVIRGEDHLSNTPKQIQIYRALNYSLPQFAHLPMIFGPDRKPLSKRHGDTAVFEYREKGFLPQALTNYLALLGWSYDDRTTIFPLDDLVERFSLEKVSKNPAVFDIKKLTWLNGYYIRQLSQEKLELNIKEFLVKSGVAASELKQEFVSKIARLLRERLEIFSQVPNWVGFLFTDEVSWDEKAWGKVMEKTSPEILEKAWEVLAEVEPFETQLIEMELRGMVEELGLKPKEVFQPIRVAVTGQMVSPPLFESLELLGKKKALRRLKKAQEALSKAS
jgi:glutamyl-tRNA synthetase